MPMLTEEIELSEVNLRFRGGMLVSREAWNRVIIKRDGETVSETGAKADLTDEQFAALLGAQAANLTSQISVLQAERDAAVAAKAAAVSAHASVQTAHDDLQTQLATANAHITELTAREAAPETPAAQ